ncbi:MAG: GGDEF domain-containing protein [Treponema sp.]|nr:GGDEF domain-containing protein [Treponema sp.]
MKELDFTSVLDAFTSPILIARPILKDSFLEDIEVVYVNDSFRNSVSPEIAHCHKLSEFRDKLNNDVPWIDIGEKACHGIVCEPYTYYSELSHKWFRMQMKGTGDSLIVVSIEDITEEKNHAQKLKKTAYHDILTGLPNRSQFNEDFPAFIIKAEFNCTKIGVLLIDIDNMKNINDSKGHTAGDELLKKAAGTLEQFEKNGIATYRFGDDEFLVVIQNQSSIDSITNVSDTIFESFLMQNINVSGGIAVYPDDSKDQDELLRFTDIAMHSAKKDGKNQFQFFKPDMQRIFIQKLNLINKMTQAVLESKFTQVYQPQFDVKTGDLRGFEALIRWRDEELGNIPPSVFIPMAEECGLIIPIGSWVLNTAFYTLRRWQESYDFKGIISINLSPIQLKQPSIVYEIENLLSLYKIDPKTIEIEITEGIMIDNMNDAIEKMKQLKEIGFKISLDDFGTGYSSLSYLQMLPLDTLKIDKSFINDITSQNGIQANITNSIIMMVSKMGLDTIAEGVEHTDQYDLLKKFNCHIIQGFLCGKPMTLERCNSYLSGDKSALLSLKNE